MTQSFPREQIAILRSEYNAVVGLASDLQCSLYRMVSMSDDPQIRMLSLQAAEAIDLVRDIAKERSRALLDAPTPKAVADQEEKAA